VNVKFEARFEKNLHIIKDTKILSKLKKIIMECKELQDLSDIRNLKKMQGYATFYTPPILMMVGDELYIKVSSTIL
jgi:mRNA interferase RelE/StbE